jgi:predicted phage-related endonuclease
LLDEWNVEDYVPYAYQLQVQHYLAVTGMQGAYVVCLVGGNQFFCRFVKRDDELIDMIIKLEQEFWQCVENNAPPPIDGSEAAKNYLNSLFPSSTKGESITLNDSCLKLVDDFEYHELQEKHSRELKDQAANELKLLIGENESAVISDKIITWKNISAERLDTKRLASEMPDIYDRYLNKSSYRRFTIKSRKGE